MTCEYLKHICHECYQVSLSQLDHFYPKAEAAISFWQSDFNLYVIYQGKEI